MKILKHIFYFSIFLQGNDDESGYKTPPFEEGENPKASAFLPTPKAIKVSFYRFTVDFCMF